jgi:hypothetical protein
MYLRKGIYMVPIVHGILSVEQDSCAIMSDNIYLFIV